jgi:ABC-2 type transport system permease protein
VSTGITEVGTLDLALRRRSLIGYSLGMAAYVVMVVALYPAFKDSTDLDSFTESSPGLAAAFGISGSLTTPTGWLSANIYANFFPLILLLMTVGYGAFCLAGQERDGHLELVLSLPFSRSRVVLQKVGVMVLQAVIFSLVVFLSSLLGRAFELTIDVSHLASTTVGVMLLGIDFGLLAMAVGARTGNRGEALGLASAIAAASYLVSSMAPLVSWLEPFRYVSLFYWSVGDGQLENGLSLASLAVLLAVGVVLAAVTARLFDRHDLS